MNHKLKVTNFRMSFRLSKIPPKNLIDFCPERLFILGMLCTHLSRVNLGIIKTNRMHLVYKTFMATLLHGQKSIKFFGGILENRWFYEIHSDIIWPLGAQQFKLTRKPLRPHCIYRLFELDTHINALPQQLMRQKVWRQQEKLVMARYFNIKVGLRLNVWSSINEFETMWVLYVWRKKI